MTKESICISFDNNKLLPQLFGHQDSNLTKIEEKLDVVAFSRGNVVSITGEADNVSLSKNVLQNMYEKIKTDNEISEMEVDAIIRMLNESPEEELDVRQETNQVKKKKPTGNIVIKTLKKHITPYTHHQAEYLKALLEKEVVIASGPAGTGKTFLAAAVAVSMFVEGKVDRIILSRPAVEAGENLGFLPGDMREKVDPYLRPLYDALYDMLPAEKVVKYMETGEIEIAPLAFMRGRTLRNAFVILDEAQNASPVQMKMFLTRMGEGTRIAITGDLSQTDLPKGMRSGLRDALEKLEEIEEVFTIKFNDNDSVRHPLTTKIIQAYEKHDDSKWDKK